MTDKLREVPKLLPCPFCGAKPRWYPSQSISVYEAISCINEDCDVQPETDYGEPYDVATAWNTRAALAAAPQPAHVDREALADLIFDNLEVDCNLTDEAVLKVADALLARGLPLPGDGSRNRVEYDDAGKLDEVVADAGMHLERMSDQGWFLSGQRSDGSEIAIWLKGKVVAVEERPAIRVVEGGDDAA